MSYQDVCGTLSCGQHPGSYNGQDAYNDMLITNEDEIMAEEKANQKERIKIPTERVRKYFPKSFSNSQIEDAIVKMCEAQYRKKQGPER